MPPSDQLCPSGRVLCCIEQGRLNVLAAGLLVAFAGLGCGGSRLAPGAVGGLSHAPAGAGGAGDKGGAMPGGRPGPSASGAAGSDGSSAAGRVAMPGAGGAAVVAGSPGGGGGGGLTGRVLIWQDEFAGPLDTSKWSRCKRGTADWNNTMSDDPRLLSIDGGVLSLHGIQNSDTNQDSAPYLTAGLTSKGKFAFQYGKVQIRARFKSAQGAWPALWMLGSGGGWPTNGEIDLMEHLNFDPKVYQTVHSYYTQKIDTTDTPPKSGTAPIHRDTWNTYGCEWTADSISFTVNGRPTHSYPRVAEKGPEQYPFTQPFYFILSMQIGGKWVNSAGPTDPTHYPASLEIDWVRVYR